MPFVLFVKKAAEAMGRPGGDFTLKIAKKGERRTVQCGISTACFYPQDTMEALSKTQQLAPPCMEIFLNTFRELEPDYVQRLAAQLRSAIAEALATQAGVEVSSVDVYIDGLQFKA